VLKNVIGILLLLPFVFVGAFFAASEWGGEVVELRTYDHRAMEFLTSVWIVELHGDLYVRAGDPDAEWVKRLLARPAVKLRRGGRLEPYEAQPIDGFEEKINTAMREKYGRADQIVGTIHDPAGVLAIRLVPVR